MVNLYKNIKVLVFLIIIFFNQPISAKTLSVIQLSKKDEIVRKLKNNVIKEVQILPLKEKEEVLCVALNIYHETRSSTLDDKIASTYTVINRYYDKKYPKKIIGENTFCNIVFDPEQYSWTNPKSIQYPSERLAWKESQKIAYKILYTEEFLENAKDILFKHYVRPEIIQKASKDSWLNNRTYELVIGSHVYMLFEKTDKPKLVFISEVQNRLTIDSKVMEQTLKGNSDTYYRLNIFNELFGKSATAGEYHKPEWTRRLK